MLSPLIAANNFILHAKREGKTITHMKLQKLLYMLYACCLNRTGKPLFSDRFEAWEYGPVLSEVYHEFKCFGGHEIDSYYQRSDGMIELAVEEGTPFGMCINEVWGKYRDYSGLDLSKITHEGGSAWSKSKEKNGGKLGFFLDDSDIQVDGGKWFGQ